jgi:hypothetical protein
MDFTKKTLGKKGMGPFVIFGLIVLGIVTLFSFAGVAKFLLSDKTPFIIVGIFIILYLIRQRR